MCDDMMFEHMTCVLHVTVNKWKKQLLLIGLNIFLFGNIYSYN